MDTLCSIDWFLFYGEFTGAVMDVTPPRNDRIVRKQCYFCFKKYSDIARSQIKCCSDECKRAYEKVRKEQRELDKREREA